MKFNRKFLIPIIIILILINVGVFSVNRVVPNSKVIPSFVYIYSGSDWNTENLRVVELVSETGITSKVKIQVVQPEDQSSYIQRYNIKGSKAFLVIDGKGSVIERLSDFPSKDELIKKANKYGQ